MKKSSRPSWIHLFFTALFSLVWLDAGCVTLGRKNSLQPSKTTMDPGGSSVHGQIRDSPIDNFGALIIQQDFGPPLIPRKNYDLRTELNIFMLCKICKWSANLGEMRDLVLTSTNFDPFIWVLRPNGTMVVSRGPEQSMTHGVIASLNVSNPKMTYGPMGSILTGGEGWFDAAKKTLYLNNKSGHFRPEFRRVKNPSVMRIFELILEPTDIKLTFIDATKQKDPQMPPIRYEEPL